MGIGWRYCSVMLIPLGILAASGAGGGGSFESIATITASGGETSLSFTSIPGTYASLQIRGIMRRADASSNLGRVYLQFNSDTGANYAGHQLRGTDAGTVSASGSASASNFFAFRGAGALDASNTFGVGIADIHDYASTTKYKTTRSFTGLDNNGRSSGTSEIYLYSGLWQSTSAITRIDLVFNGDTAAAGTTFALYGIKGA
jgi:hypothetical protein